MEKAASWALKGCYSRNCRFELDCEAGEFSALSSRSRRAGKLCVRSPFCTGNWVILMQIPAVESAHTPDSHEQGPLLRGFYLIPNVTRVIVDFGRLVMCRRRVKRSESTQESLVSDLCFLAFLPTAACEKSWRKLAILPAEGEFCTAEIRSLVRRAVVSADGENPSGHRRAHSEEKRMSWYESKLQLKEISNESTDLRIFRFF